MKTENETPTSASPSQTPAPLPPSYKSVEFWLALVVALAAFGEQLAGILPAEVAITVAAISAGFYKIARVLRELGNKGGGQ